MRWCLWLLQINKRKREACKCSYSRKSSLPWRHLSCQQFNTRHLRKRQNDFNELDPSLWALFNSQRRGLSRENIAPLQEIYNRQLSIGPIFCPPFHTGATMVAYAANKSHPVLLGATIHDAFCYPPRPCLPKMVIKDLKNHCFPGYNLAELIGLLSLINGLTKLREMEIALSTNEAGSHVTKHGCSTVHQVPKMVCDN